MGLISRVSSRTYRQMVRLGDLAPNFKANSTQGEIDFHEWLGNSWGILFSHPADFTPVCTTELAKCAQLKNEFQERNVKIAAYSCDSVEDHIAWSKDVESYGSCQVWFPIIEEKDLIIIKFNPVNITIVS